MSAALRPLAAAAALAAAPSVCAQQVRFDRDVLPLLSDRCFQCHGPDARAREADLRLDDRADLVRDRGGYAVVRPGDPGASELIARVTARDEAQMPPAHANLALRAEEIETLRAWIAEGAPWSVHWSYQPSRPTAPPRAAATGGGDHPI
ncbi:MAG: c-type cytochrome domain-containing protein, partial [Planctomycetota bacterium]